MDPETPEPPAEAVWVACGAAGVSETRGPLAVAALLVEPRGARALAALDWTDRDSLPRLRALVRQIKSVVPVETVVVGEGRRAWLGAKLGKPGQLLAWAQAKAMAELLARYPAARHLACDMGGPELLELRALARIPGGLELVRTEVGDRGPGLWIRAAREVARVARHLARAPKADRAGGVRPRGAR